MLWTGSGLQDIIWTTLYQLQSKSSSLAFIVAGKNACFVAFYLMGIIPIKTIWNAIKTISFFIPSDPNMTAKETDNLPVWSSSSWQKEIWTTSDNCWLCTNVQAAYTNQAACNRKHFQEFYMCFYYSRICFLHFIQPWAGILECTGTTFSLLLRGWDGWRKASFSPNFLHNYLAFVPWL